jgi:hypothetical protein
MLAGGANEGMALESTVGGVGQCPTAAASDVPMSGVPQTSNITEELLALVRELSLSLIKGTGEQQNGTCQSCGLSRGGSGTAASSSGAGITGPSPLPSPTQSNASSSAFDLSSLFDIGGSVVGSLFGGDSSGGDGSFLETAMPLVEQALPMLFAML